MAKKKIIDPETKKERDETDEEEKARLEAEAKGDEGDDDDDIEKVRADRDRWRKEARKWEGRAKENAGAADKLKALEDQNKTEAQKAEDARKAAEADRDSTKAELLRLRVAMKKGLTDAQAKRLVGTTEEELEADADELLSSFRSGDDGDGETSRVMRRPSEIVKPGTGKPKEPPQDAKSIVDTVMAKGR